MHSHPRRLRRVASAVALIAALLPAGPVALPVLAVDPNPCALGGTGVEGDPFQVATEANLVCVRDTAAYWAARLVQTADVALTAPWTSGIGSAATPFSGMYDGGGHAVTGLAITAVNPTGSIGFVDYLGSGTVANLSVSGSVTASKTVLANVGGLIGEGGGGAVSNVTLDVDVTVTATGSASAIGGFAGSWIGAWGAPADVTSSGDVQVTASAGSVSGVGGLIGQAMDGSMTHVTAHGAVTVTAGQPDVAGTSSAAHVGGLVGYAYQVTITQGVADGGVTVAATAATPASASVDYVGGIVGYAQEATLDDARSTGLVSVDGTGDITATGGVAGGALSSTITASRSAADVAVASSFGAASSVGGLAGAQAGGTVLRSSASGMVSLAAAAAGDIAGGLIGFASSNAYIRDVYATGDVATTGGQYIGGLVGILVSSTLGRAYATGHVTGTTNVGGIIGAQNALALPAATDLSFFNTETAGVAAGTGFGDASALVGLPAARLQARATYAAGGTEGDVTWTSAWPIADGWESFAAASISGNAWGICPGANGGYPFLLRDHLTNPCARTLTITAPEHGGVTADALIECPGAACEATPAFGSEVVLVAHPADTYLFGAWTGACAGELTDTCHLLIDGDKTVGVTFLSTAPVFTKAPVVTLRSGAALSTPGAAGILAPVTVSWAAVATSSSIDGYILDLSRDGGATWVSAIAFPPSATGASISLPTTGTVMVRVTAHAASGAVAQATSAQMTLRLVQQSSTSVKFSGTWTTATGSAYSGGSVKWTKGVNASATYAFTGSGIGLVTARAALRGKVFVYVDGVKRATLDLRGATSNRLVAYVRGLAYGPHTVKVVALGTAGRPRVDLDGFVVLRVPPPIAPGSAAN